MKQRTSGGGRGEVEMIFEGKVKINKEKLVTQGSHMVSATLCLAWSDQQKSGVRAGQQP